MRSLWLAVQFLTVAPVRLAGPVRPEELGRSLAWYPLVGAALGLAVGGAGWAGRWAGLPVGVVGALMLALTIGLTGGLHLDGLLDTCDGVFSHRSPEERLAIMRDPRVGSFGVAGGVCLLLLTYGALTALPTERLVGAAIAAFALGRTVMVGAAVLAPHGRPDGLGARITAGAGRRELGIALVSGGALALLAGGATGALWAVAAGIGGLTLTRWLLTRLPGLTGDTYGALNEATEAIVLSLAAWRGFAPG